jgi:hypothetical protein
MFCAQVRSDSEVKLSVRNSSRKNRVFIFRSFLLETYSECYQNDKFTVLDVAGGKGDLSWLLCNVDNIRSIVVDPRSKKHHHLLRSIEYLKEHPEEARERAIPNVPSHQPLAGLLSQIQEPYVTPLHLQIWVNHSLVEALRSYLTTGEVSEWITYWKTITQCVTPELSRNCESNLEISKNVDAEEALSWILEAKLIVGFHPDQATEACIDLALLLKVDYCIVPCCVFPSEFPHRRSLDGQRVRCYEEFIEYLVSKDPQSIRTTTLSFYATNTARNIVLYRKDSKTTSGIS